MQDRIAQLEELLNLSPFRVEIRNACVRLHSMLINSVAMDTDTGEFTENSEESVDLEEGFKNLRHEYVPVISRHIVEHLLHPPVVTLDDLISEVPVYLAVGEAEHDSALRKFADNLWTKIDLQSRSSPFRIMNILGQVEDSEFQFEGWYSNDEFLLVKVAGPIEQASDEAFGGSLIRQTPIYAAVVGAFTDSAMASFVEDFGPLVMSMVRSCEVLKDLQKSWMSRNKTYTEVPVFLFNEDVTEASNFLKTSLDIYFWDCRNRDNMNQRLRNAMIFLSESDRQKNHALATALCFVALESMLSSRMSNITETLAARATALLEPQKRHRGDAISFFRGCYDKRSRVLHGDETEQLREERVIARTLGAAVLKALIERNAYVRKGGGTPDAKELFTELDDARETAAVILGPELSPVTSYWRPQAKGFVCSTLVVEKADLDKGRIRIPTSTDASTKSLFPNSATNLDVIFRGRLIQCEWDPRCGTERERPGILLVGRVLRWYVYEKEVLSVERDKQGRLKIN